MKKTLLILLILSLTAGTAYWYLYLAKDSNAEGFIATFGDYHDIAEDHRDMALVPGLGRNEVRQELNTALTRVLTDTSLDADAQLELANSALNEVSELGAQIRDIEEQGKKVEEAIHTMELRTKKIRNIPLKKQAKEVSARARQHMSAANQIGYISENLKKN